jgi:xanthine dehydrogenase accessory factor
VIPVLVDPETRARQYFLPQVVVDAVMAKRNTGTRLTDAPFVVALGPGFVPGVDCHAVVETQRGHDLGRVLLDRAAEPNSGLPGKIGGKSAERLLRAPCDGSVLAVRQIGDRVAAGETIAEVAGAPVRSAIDGIVRGLVHDGLSVKAGMKIGDVDPRAKRENCYTISDKSLAIGGGVLEAVLSWMNVHPR